MRVNLLPYQAHDTQSLAATEVESGSATERSLRLLRLIIPAITGRAFRDRAWGGSYQSRLAVTRAPASHAISEGQRAPLAQAMLLSHNPINLSEHYRYGRIDVDFVRYGLCF